MYDKITLCGDLNVDYMWARSNSDITIPETPNLEKPVWDGHTVALAQFNKDASASSYDGGSFKFDKYKIYRKDKDSATLKYVATVDSYIKKIKDYTNFSNNECTYYIYPVNDNNKMGTVIKSSILKTSFNYWTIAGVVETGTKNVYEVDKDNIWSFYLNPEISSISQATQKSKKNGFTRYPKIQHSEVNYATGTMSFLLGDLNCIGDEYDNDTVTRKNKWVEFANSPTPKILTDPKGECLFVDITPMESSVNFNLIQSPTTIRFEFTEISDINNITVYDEVSN